MLRNHNPIIRIYLIYKNLINVKNFREIRYNMYICHIIKQTRRYCFMVWFTEFVIEKKKKIVKTPYFQVLVQWEFRLKNTPVTKTEYPLVKWRHRGVPNRRDVHFSLSLSRNHKEGEECFDGQDNPIPRWKY